MRAVFFFVALLTTSAAFAADREHAVRARMDDAVAQGEPLVAHIVVALADNMNQGIVPVPKAIGNGQKPETNLYWGAGYGVRHFFGKKAGWKQVKVLGKPPAYVLDRVAFTTSLTRGGRTVTAYVIADAYDGARIKEATRKFLEIAAGRTRQSVELADGTRVGAGGRAHLVTYVGHDGLMDFDIPTPEREETGVEPRAAMVLACVSRTYFGPHLERTGAHPLLLTTGLMAPEAYTVDAAIRAWFAGGSTTEVRERAAQAYDRYQKCGLGGARRLFGLPARKAGGAAAGR